MPSTATRSAGMRPEHNERVSLTPHQRNPASWRSMEGAQFRRRTTVSRRSLLAALGGLAASTAFATSALSEALVGHGDADDGSLFASAYKHANGGYGIALIDDFGQILGRVSLPDRGHGFAVSPDRQRLVAFARRPGTFAVLIEPFRQAEPQVIVSAQDRHFYGHGSFSRDGRLLYAVENDFPAARGVVGIYDVSGNSIQRVGEFDTHGIGPHEMLLSADGTTLVVANGGIRTHPDRGREKLNLDTMAPSVVFLDARTGDLRAEHRLDRALHQLSLRHMAFDAAGRVWVGGQFEGPDDALPPLVAVIGQDAVPRLTEVPEKLGSRLRNYIGSVAANRYGEVIATTAPRGGETLFWKAATFELLGSRPIADGCGVAPSGRDGFLVSDGHGAFSLVDDLTAPEELLARPPGYAWDNHMHAIGAFSG